tara:strand:+ start:752 stop:1921 length:1170 start_codon:yes stop_codon:yes gene_type:complete
MKDYNPKEVHANLNAEQQAIKDFRIKEYHRKYGIKSEDKVNQESPNPQGVFQVELQALARKLVENASDLTNKKKKGEIDNYKYSANMAVIERSVNELGAFSQAAQDAMNNYNENLKNGTLSYGMDQYDEGVLQGLNKGTVKLNFDKDGRVLLNGKAENPLIGEFDVNIYDVNNVPATVPKIKPINLALDPVAEELGLDENGQPLLRVDQYGNKMYDSGPYSSHSKRVLDFSQDALQTLGTNGVRSYLADHMQLPQSQVKEMIEDTAYTDPDGTEWDNRGTAEAFASISEYIGNKYNRQQRPHPDTISKMAKLKASKIAQEKGIRPEEVSFNEALGIQESQPVEPSFVPNVQEGDPLALTLPPVAEIAAEETEVTPKGEVSVEELIKKYS